MIPCPFSSGAFCWGEPVYVPAELDEALFEEKRLELQQRLIDLNEQADNLWSS